MDKILTNVARHMDFLAGQPSRHVGSDGERAAAFYIEDYFRSIGLPVRRESYPVRGWRYASCTLSRGDDALPSVCQYFSGPCDFTGALTHLAVRAAADLPSADYAGSCCYFADPHLPMWERNAIAEELERRGAKAVIFADFGTGYGPSAKACRSAKLRGDTAVVCVGLDTAAALSARPGDVFTLRVDAHPFDTEVCNVIATVGRGSRYAAVGAHFDAAPNIAAAADNASGTAALLETARLLKDYDGPYTVDLCAFSAEEYIPTLGACPPGSADYVRRWSGRTAWYWNFDDLGARYSTLKLLLGHPEKLPQAEWPIAPELSAQASDDRTFFEAGIPTAWLYGRQQNNVIHTMHDTRSYVDDAALADGVRMAYGCLRELLVR